MQSYETPETIVHEPAPGNTESAEARSQDTWSGDRPIYLTLAGSALATAAAVPVMLAVWGPTPVFKLMYAAVLAGMLTAMTGLLLCGAVVGGLRIARSLRTGQTQPSAKPSRGLRGKLAFS